MTVMTHTAQLKRVAEVRALEPYRIWLRYPDGVQGEVDLGHLVDTEAFSVWRRDPDVFKHVAVDEHGVVCWPGDLDLCPDALYMQITGLTPRDLFGGWLSEPDDA